MSEFLLQTLDSETKDIDRHNVAASLHTVHNPITHVLLVITNIQDC